MTDLLGPRQELLELGFDVQGLDPGARAMYESLSDEEVGSLCAIVRDLASDDVEGFGLRRRGNAVADVPTEHLEAVSENVRALARLYLAQQEESRPTS